MSSNNNQKPETEKPHIQTPLDAPKDVVVSNVSSRRSLNVFSKLNTRRRKILCVLFVAGLLILMGILLNQYTRDDEKNIGPTTGYFISREDYVEAATRNLENKSVENLDDEEKLYYYIEKLHLHAEAKNYSGVIKDYNDYVNNLGEERLHIRERLMVAEAYAKTGSKEKATDIIDKAIAKVDSMNILPEEKSEYMEDINKSRKDLGI